MGVLENKYKHKKMGKARARARARAKARAKARLNFFTLTFRALGRNHIALTSAGTIAMLCFN